jgi:hypothetical protein
MIFVLPILETSFNINKPIMPENIMKIPLLFIFIFIGSCNNDPITPEEIQPGRRDYEWTIDTLPLPAGTAFIPTRLWGLTSDDVRMMRCGDAGYRIWRFNSNLEKNNSTGCCNIRCCKSQQPIQLEA